MCIKILHFKQGLKQTTVVIACTVVIYICICTICIQFILLLQRDILNIYKCSLKMGTNYIYINDLGASDEL